MVLCIFWQPNLDKLVTMATKRGLSMICKILNFAITHLGKFIEFLTLALNAWILPRFSIYHWNCTLSVVLILVGVEFPL